MLAFDISRSDIHFWRTGRIGSLVVEGDCILGHEAAGIVLQCGEGVKNLKPGKRKLNTEDFIEADGLAKVTA